jgi:hypothetical protein
LTPQTKLVLKLASLACAVGATLALAQDPLSVLPGNYRVIYENPLVRVVHVLYRAHEKLPLHDHSKTPTVYVYLSDSGPVRFSHVEAHAFTIVRPPETAGTFRVSPGRIEKHEVENLGDIPSEFLRVELKAVPLGFQSGSFRSPKNFERTETGITTEFSSPSFTIERVIAAAGRPANVKQAAGPALFIAFSPAVLKSSDPGLNRAVQSGDLVWADQKSSLTVSAKGSAVANLLGLTFVQNRNQ